jgi:predicted ATP-dependent endonuclease of OLD family
MYDMWKIIWHTAKKLNIQVFATTHNSDCWTSLANFIEDENLEQDEEGIYIHRIEKEQEKSVVLNARQIVIAANRDIEVR